MGAVAMGPPPTAEGGAAEDVPMEGAGQEPEAADPVELEQDAPEDPQPRVAETEVAWKLSESTLNVLPAPGGVFTTLKQGAFQHLIASVRTTVGLKSGRYFFEAQVLESTAYPDTPVNNQPLTTYSARYPKQVARIGFALGGATRFLGDAEGLSVSFDSDGIFAVGVRRLKVCPAFEKGQIMAVLLNLDAQSENANTVSLFMDGVRASPPQPLPGPLCGKALFPTITYQNTMLSVNLGPDPLAPLPFTCRTVRDVSKGDVELCPDLSPADGKYEVVFPVGIPDTGLFEWADHFLESNPQYTEISDRKILSWAAQSGLWCTKAPLVHSDSRDKPFIQLPLEHGSVSKVIYDVVPMLKRNYLVLEMKANLIPAERKKALAWWGAPHFQKVAAVAIGEPTADYKAKVQELLLGEAQAKRRIQKRKKDTQTLRKTMLEAKKKMCEASKKERAERAQQHTRPPPKKEEEPKKEEPKKEAPDAKEEAKEEVKEEKAEAKEEIKEEVEEEKEVQLTAEQKKAWFRKSDVPDLAPNVIATSYALWSLPTEAEGFDKVRFDWDAEEKAHTVLRGYVAELKRTQRVEDLQPHAWFKEKFVEFQTILKGWRAKQGARKAAKVAPPQGDDFDADLVEVGKIVDVCDIGNGVPLFASFEYEDWLLLTARAEMHLLAHSYRKALDDPEREAILEKDLAFYYERHFQKPLRLGAFECTKLEDLIALIKDTASIDAQGRLIPACDEDTSLDQLLRQTEDRRRERQLRIDAGDEAARLKFKQPTQPAQPAPARVKAAAANVVSPKPAAAAPGPGALSATTRPGTPAAPKDPAATGPAAKAAAAKAAVKAAAAKAALASVAKAAAAKAAAAKAVAAKAAAAKANTVSSAQAAAAKAKAANLGAAAKANAAKAGAAKPPAAKPPSLKILAAKPPATKPPPGMLAAAGGAKRVAPMTAPAAPGAPAKRPKMGWPTFMRPPSAY